jgi:hypothetical protein
LALIRYGHGQRLRWIIVEKQDAQLRPLVSAERRPIGSVLAANTTRIENSANRVKLAVPQGPSGAANSFLKRLPDLRGACCGNCFTPDVKSRGSNTSRRGASIE